MKPKEDSPGGGEAPGPPPPAVIDLCSQSQSEEDSYMPEQVAGVKRRPEAEAETPESDEETQSIQNEAKQATVPSVAAQDSHAKDQTDPSPMTVSAAIERKKQENDTNNNDDSPPQFDDNEDTILTFAEMFNFLHGEMQDLDIDKAMEVDSATEYMQCMFAQVFTSHPAEQLEEGKCHYPQLDAAELDVLLRLFIQDRKVGRADPRKWKGRLYDITRAIYKSRRSLIDIVEHRITTAQVTGQSLTNMWAIRAATTASENVDQDVDMTEDTTSSFRFHRATYSPEDIEELRRLCEIAYGFPTQLRKPTNKETKIIKGLVEGTILCSRLPDFLKRICSNEALRKIQNTIHAQVEGDLLIKLQPEFPVYPDFQTKARLIGNITMGLENGRHDKQTVIELLQNAKQVYYDRKVHAVHIIFWTREMAAKWSHEVKTLPFRNRTFPLINEHPDDTYTSSPGPVNSAEVWKRQVGADGVTNENPRARYHVRLLNVSRCMDEAAIDAYIQQRFEGIYTTWQEPSSGNQILQTDTWDIFFKWPGCPSFLAGKRFVNWDGIKILVHHVSAKAAYPCFQCGASGHNRNRCNTADDQWKHPGVCITVTAAEIAILNHRESTLTSEDDLDKLWLDEPVDNGPAPIHRPIVGEPVQQRNAVPPSPNNSPSSMETRESNQWVIANRGRQTGSHQTTTSRTGGTATVQTPRALLRHDKPDQNSAPAKTNQFQVLDTTENEQEPVTLVEHSPAEENRMNYSLKSQQMDKVQRLIMKQVTSKRLQCPSENLDRITNLDISKLPVGKGKGGLILKQCGLEEVQALPYGNCQYYSIAMALLNRECSQPGEAKILETLTSKLKKGIAAAANHFFAEEFPHRSRMQMLEVQNDEKVKLTPSQSAEALQHHFNDISGSKSHPDSCIDRRSWGSTTTLRMLAKILHRNIYVVEASSGMGTANFSLFTAGERVCNGVKFMTAKECIFTPSEITDWIKLLKDECTEKASTEGPPLVIIFRSNHYNWLRFAVEEKSSTSVSIIANNSTPDNAMDFDEDFMMEDTEEATNVQTKVATQAELPPKITQPLIIQETIPPAQSTETKLRSLAEQEEHDAIEKFGGARKEELTVFSTTGINALIPAHRQPLRDMDMSDDAEVLQWCLQYDISKDVLGEWQRDLRSRESQETYTPSPTPPTPQSDSQWSAETTAEPSSESQTVTGIGEGVEQQGVGRFKGDTDIPTGIRQQMKQLRSQWNQLRSEWESKSSTPFPAMPSTPGKWNEAILAAPKVLRSLLQKHASPEFILSDMTEAHFDTWTKKERFDCLIQSLEHYAGELGPTNLKTADWVSKCVREFQQQADSDMEALNLFPVAMWKTLKLQHFGNSQFLRLCRKSKRVTLARMIITATVYIVEIQAIVQNDSTRTPQTTLDKLTILFELLEKKPKIHALIYQADSTGLWAKLETMLAGMDLYEEPDEESYAGSESPAL